MSDSTLVKEGLEVSYSPSAVLNLFNNSINIQQTKKLIPLKGIYQDGGYGSYGNIYYDKLKDEASDACLTLIVPALLRSQLINNKTISFWGFITKRVVASSGRIDVHVHLSELIEQSNNKFNEDEIRALEIQQRKASVGYRDVEAFLGSQIVKGTTTKIAIIIGKTAIIGADIKHQQGVATQPYELVYDKVSFTSEQEVLSAISKHETGGADIIVLARGGGEGLDLFNKPSIAERCIGMKPYLITALGHKENMPLAEKVADKSVITPTALGQFFKDVYEHTVEELQKSKAKLVDAVKVQLEANYGKQIQNLKDQLQSSEKLRQEETKGLQRIMAEQKLGADLVQKQKAIAMEQQLQAKDETIRSLKAQIDAVKMQIETIKRKPAPATEPEVKQGLILLVLAILVVLGLVARGC